jgi:FMN reductase
MVVVLSGNPRPHSRTRQLGERVAAVLAARLGHPDPHTVDVAELGHRLLRPGDPDVAAALARLRTATLLLVATPTYKGSYTGVLKVLLDALPADGLCGMAAVPVVSAGTADQAANAERHLRDLLTQLGAAPLWPTLRAVGDRLDDPGALADAYARQLPDPATARVPS